MSNGIAGLRGYQEGDLVEDDPGWLQRLWERRRKQQQQSTRPGPTVGYGPTVPEFPRPNLAYRQIIADVLGKQIRERLGMEGLGNLIGSRDITASDLSPAEYEALQDAAISGMGGQLADQGGLLGYGSYDTSEDKYADVGGTHVRLPGGLSQARDMVKKMMDPSYSMKLTFGQARVVRGDEERGEDPNDYYISDRYNFNEGVREDPTRFGRSGEGEPPGFLDMLRTRVSGSGIYGIPRAVGQAYGSPPGEGSIARVNLGNLEEALARSRGEDEGIFAQIMNRIRGLRGDDERETVAQYVPEPEIPSAPPSLASFISPDFIPDFSEPPREIMARNILEE